MGIKWLNEYFDNGECIVIRISKEETGENYDVLIDYIDYEKVKLGQWFVINPRKNSEHKDIYNIVWSKVENNIKCNYYIHQYILNTKNKSLTVDHINMDRLDNRRNNLRIVTNSVNSLNKPMKGYRLDSATGKYLSRITYNGKMYNIGRYNTPEEAEEIFLKCCLIVGRQDISYDIQNKISNKNILLSENDYNNKYIKKMMYIVNNKDIPDEMDSRNEVKYKILENIGLIKELVSNGLSWNDISKTLDFMGILKTKGRTIKKHYTNFIL